MKIPTCLVACSLALLGCSDPEPSGPDERDTPIDSPAPPKPDPKVSAAKLAEYEKKLAAEEAKHQRQIAGLQAAVLESRGRNAELRRDWPRAAVLYTASLGLDDLPATRVRALHALEYAWGCKVLTGQGGPVIAVAWSPDGKLLATAQGDGSLILRDAAGKLLGVLKGHEQAATRLVWSPDGKRLASGAKDKVVRVWDAAAPKSIRVEKHEGDVHALGWSPDGKHVASAAKGEVYVWDPAAEGRKVCKHPKTVRTLAWVPSGGFFATGGDDGKVRLWGAAGEAGAVLEGHTKSVRQLAWSPDGSRLASGSRDRTVRLWDAKGKHLATLEGHQREVTAVAWSSDGLVLASASADGEVRVWNTQTATLLAAFDGHTDFVVGLAWSSGNALATVSWDGRVGLVEPTRKGGDRSLTFLPGHTDQVLAVGWSPDASRLVSGSADKTVRLWDLDMGVPRTKRKVPAPITALAAAPGGKRVLVAVGKSIQLWIDREKPKLALEGHEDQVLAVAIAPDGKRALSGSQDKTVRLWDLEEGKEIGILEGHGDAVTAVAWSPKGKLVASGSVDKTIRLWAAGGKPIELTHPDSVWDLAWSPDGKHLASACKDKVVRVWDAQTHVVVTAFKGHEGSVNSVAWSPDGKLLASGSDDETVRVWRVSGEAVGVLRGHTEAVRDVVWSSDRLLASAAWDHKVALWTVEGGRLAVLEAHYDFVDALAWAGSWLISGARDRRLIFWNTPMALGKPGELRAFAERRTGLRVEGLDVQVVPR